MICVHWYELLICALVGSLVSAIGASVTTQLRLRRYEGKRTE